MTLRRFRCLLCLRPWGATPAARRRCPFCGSDATQATDEVLEQMHTSTPAARRAAYLFAGMVRP